jgi:hypothetical protein
MGKQIHPTNRVVKVFMSCIEIIIRSMGYGSCNARRFEVSIAESSARIVDAEIAQIVSTENPGKPRREPAKTQEEILNISGL